MTWKKSDMKQYHRFLQDIELVPRIELLGMKSLDTTCFKTAGFTPVMVQCIH